MASLDRQTFRDWNIVAVLHACTDGSEALLREAGAQMVFYPENEPFNYSRALNLGAEVADSPYLLNLSSHVELIRDDTISTMVDLLDSDPSIASVSASRFFPGEDPGPPRAPGISTFESFTCLGGLANYCGMIRKSLWERRPFREEMPTVEDIDWAVWAMREGHKTGWLRGHGIWYRNPRYSYRKIIRERMITGFVLATCSEKKAFRQLADLSLRKAKRYARSPGLRRRMVTEGMLLGSLWLLSKSSVFRARATRQLCGQFPSIKRMMTKEKPDV